MSTGQALGGVVGAVAGALIGGPTGAISGAQIGMMAGGYLDPPKGPTIQGPRLNDLSVQTSAYGAFIQRLYGVVGGNGNFLWLENNQLKETVRKKKSGGKGGGGSATTVTYSYSATFALGLCQGPIAGVRRIWCGDKLIYNAASDDLETVIASNKAAKGWRLYRGTDDQMPDSRYEADVGVGNASAFRGIAYLAFYDFKLADYSNTLQAAQFKVEVVSADGAEVKTLLDITPAISSVFGAGSVFSAGSDMQRIELMDSATMVAPDGTSTVYMRTLNVGTLKAISAPRTLSGAAPGVTPKALKSNDGKRWMQHENAALNGVYLVSEAGERITTFWLNYAQDIAEVRRATLGGGAVQVSYVFTWGGVMGGLSTISFARVILGGTVPSVIETSTNLAADKWPSTAGDEPFNWAWAGAEAAAKTISVEVYDVSISGVLTVVHTFSAALPNTWPLRGAGYREDLAPIVCRIQDRVVYLACRDRVDPNQYRYAAVSADGLLFEYAVPSPYASTQPTLSAVWPGGDNSGTIQTTNRLVQFSQSAGGTVQVASVITQEASLSGLIDQSDIDVSLITSTARGYRVSGGTIRAALEPLQGAFPFDVIQSGYKIKCVQRGQSVVANIPWGDMGASSGEVLQQSREMDTQLPARTTIKYLDAVREYAISEQHSERINTDAVNRIDRDLPLVLTADEAAGVAEVLQFLPWLERTDAAFILPPTYHRLEPSDIVAVMTPEAQYEFRLTEINYASDGRLECKAKPSRAALYTPNASGGEGVTPDGSVPLSGASVALLLDIPVIDETIQNAVGFVAVMGGETNGWPGGLLLRSNDSGQTWTDLQAFSGQASAGTVRGVLPSSPCTLIDQRSIVVDLFAGELESITRDQMLSGQNYAAYGADGRWEIVRFQNASTQADGSYLVSGFVRGEKGTEWATGLHAAGDYFVLLDDPDNAFVGSPVEAIALGRTYRAVTSGDSIDTASDIPFTYRGVNLECLSPAYAKGVRDGSGNFSGAFTRRSRLSSSWWATGVVAPVGEASESYEIDVMSGSTVKRTITASTPSFTYSAASQTTDFGSAQASIAFRIYQLSGTVGRGYPLEVTL